MRRPASSGREKAVRLRRALIESGRDYQCSQSGCALRDVWNGRELRLTVDHINGVPTDCRAENLRFLCPNCHSQTPTWGKNQNGTSITSSAVSYRRYRAKKKTHAPLGELAEPPV